MKHKFLAILILMTPWMSHAVVADSFSCKLEIQDKKGHETSQEFKFQMMRLPLSTSPAPDVRMTGSSMEFRHSLNTPDFGLYANLTFYYNHAMKIDGTGKVLEARQKTCMALSVTACSKKDDLNMCSNSTFACMPTPPFDPVKGWGKVGLIGGVPTFQERDLSSTTAEIQDQDGTVVGTAILNCEFKGTYL
jgi:hypothetical protein